MHGLEQIISTNAKAGSGAPVDLTAFKPWTVQMSGLNTDSLGWSAFNAETGFVGPAFATYAQGVADMIARHAGNDNPVHLGFGPSPLSAGNTTQEAAIQA